MTATPDSERIDGRRYLEAALAESNAIDCSLGPSAPGTSRTWS